MPKYLNDIRAVLSFIIAPLVFLTILISVDINPQKPQATAMLAVAVLMAILWISEKISISITALFPVVLFPLLGIMDGKDVSKVYFNHIIFLFIGGFLVAIAMQKWNLHKRIAYRILMASGEKPLRVFLGFILGTFGLSMWISNTATTMMMLPIALSVLAQMEDLFNPKNLKKFGIGLLLAIAYSSSIGGIATLIGTPPNPIFLRIFQINFPQAPEISFASWFIFAFPLALILLGVLIVVIWYFFLKKINRNKSIQQLNFEKSYRELGAIRYEEKVVMWLFLALAILWMTRAPIEIGAFHFSGWASLFSNPKYFNDGTVGMFVAMLLFLWPAKEKEKSSFLMEWKDTVQLPWGIIILFGGGFALAEGFKSSGLSESIGQMLQQWSDLPLFGMILLVSFTMIFLTELTSNSSSTVIILPILAVLSQVMDINPLYLMIPATISASMAFMLPVATPPNALVFSSEKLKIMDMARVGLVLNLVIWLIVSIYSYFLVPVLFSV